MAAGVGNVELLDAETLKFAALAAANIGATFVAIRSRLHMLDKRCDQIDAHLEATDADVIRTNSRVDRILERSN
jgi:hypothetical protein